MVIDVDDELFIEIGQAGSRDVGTLDHEHCVIRGIDCRSNSYVAGAGQLLVSVGHWIAHDDFDIFIERAQQPVKTKRRAQTVTVRANVRGDRETTFCLDQLDYLTKHNATSGGLDLYRSYRTY